LGGRQDVDVLEGAQGRHALHRRRATQGKEEGLGYECDEYGAPI
jgi:hypothetical protein